MALIVQKYGGTSVGSVDRIQNVAAKIKEQWSKGNRIVVVVSARSGVTNDLIARAKALSKLPDEREMDVLMAVGEQETIALTVMALHAIGVPAVSRTGAQAGIFTDDIHTRARITRRWRDKDLAALYFSALDIGLTRRDKLRFLRGYFQRPLRQVLADEAALLAWLERKAQKLYDRKQRYGDAL